MKNYSVAIIDYKMGNLFSVKQACEYAGLIPCVTSSSIKIMQADAVILPGVGAFGDAMNNLKELGLISVIKKYIKNNKPFFGVCLGMQLLMSESEEFGQHEGLNIINGIVKRFPAQDNNIQKVPVPQMNWNQISRPLSAENYCWENTFLQGINNGECMYFIHSYYAMPKDKKIILSITKYAGIEYCSSILQGNVFACQFHPEKSAGQGLKIYENLAKIIRSTN